MESRQEGMSHWQGMMERSVQDPLPRFYRALAAKGEKKVRKMMRMPV